MHGIRFLDRVDTSSGRFLAVNEIKLMWAFTLLRYDIKMENGEPPVEQKFGSFLFPDIKAEILYRKRVI
jgi:hypothetical protein